MSITLIGFDADDTLWHSESHFALTEDRFQAMVRPWSPPDVTAERLLNRERANLEIFGYGVKGFVLSMIETAIEVSENAIPVAAIEQIIQWGKEMMAHPVELLDGVETVIDQLNGNYRTVIITKGDLFHQESKIAESGLADRFDHIEILSEKSPDNYRGVLHRCGETPARQFVMVGNSVRSDVLPVVEIGGHGVHVPYQVTWGHEVVADPPADADWHQLPSLLQLPELVARLSG